jgi:hypothetical protein
MREIIPLDDSEVKTKASRENRALTVITNRAYYIYKNSKRGQNITLPRGRTGRFRELFSEFVAIYIEELVAELVTGAVVWLPARFGELWLYAQSTSKSYNAYNGGPRINYHVFVHWGHRYRFKFGKYIKVKMTRQGMFKKIVTYFQNNPDERSKLSQML